MSKEMMNAAEVAEYLGMSRNHIYVFVRDRRIPFARPGGRKLVFPKRLIDEWIEWCARSNFKPEADHQRSGTARKTLGAVDSRFIGDLIRR